MPEIAGQGKLPASARRRRQRETTWTFARFVGFGSRSSSLPAPPARNSLPLPANLVDFSSPEGEHYLIEAEANADYFPLASQFVTQKTQAYCGIASLTMVLNAMGAEAPSTPEYEPYKYFTQDNVLNAETDAILPREVLARQGTTLDQLGALVAYRGLSGEVHHAGDETLDAFRARAREALSTRDHYVIVNYLRGTLGQQDRRPHLAARGL